MASFAHADEFTLLADESTDEANREQLDVYGMWISERVMSIHYLGIVQLTKCDAESITDAITGFFKAKGLEMEKLRFMAFDGCNTMSGRNTGVQRRLVHLAPLAKYVRCRNHLLALCLVHLLKTNTLLKEVDAGLLSLWKLFEFSPKKLAVLKQAQSVYGETALLILKAAPTRWLSHGKACARLNNRYQPIVEALVCMKIHPNLMYLVLEVFYFAKMSLVLFWH